MIGDLALRTQIMQLVGEDSADCNDDGCEIDQARD